MIERTPAVAGLFYPDDPVELMATVDRLIGPDPRAETAVALVVPHAGYMYSGEIAGAVYRQVRVPETVIVLCPNHTGHGARAAIMTDGRWRIPGRSVPIDTDIAEELQGLALLSEDTVAHAQEHSLEVHLPFLVRRRPEVRFVPICLSMLPYESCARIGTAIADVVIKHGRDVLVVASTDMSHYVPADVAAAQDRLALDCIDALDTKGLYRTVADRDISMCGVVPTTVALAAAQALGAQTADLVQYGHSGETSGDFERVVGYAGYVIR